MPPSPEQITELRQLGQKIAHAYDDSRSYWWRIGALGLRGTSEAHTKHEMLKALQIAGRIPHLSANQMKRMQSVVRRYRSAGLGPEDVRGCPLEYARAAIQHFNKDRITRRQLQVLLRARRKHVGQTGRSISFSKIRAPDNVHDLLDSIQQP